MLVLLAAPAMAQGVPATTSPSIQLDTIEVQGRGETATGPVNGYVATRTATGSKTDTPILEIPQTINVVTADQIRAQGAQSVSEAALYRRRQSRNLWRGFEIRQLHHDPRLQGRSLP